MYCKCIEEKRVKKGGAHMKDHGTVDERIRIRDVLFGKEPMSKQK